MTSHRTARLSTWLCSLLVGLCCVAPSGEARAQAAAGVEVHVQALGSLDPAQRIAAIRALGEARDPQTVGHLSRVLQADPSPEVRGWAIRSLAAIGTAEARGAISSAAQRDADERVRTLATQTLGTVAAAPWQAAAPVYAQPVPLMRPQRARRPGLGLIIAGWAIFGSTYLISILSAAGDAAELNEGEANESWPLFLPIVGPFIVAGQQFGHEDDGWDFEPHGAFGALALLDGLAQTAGLTLAILGHVRRARSRQAEEAPAEEPTARARQIAFFPSGPGDGPGLSFGMTF